MCHPPFLARPRDSHDTPGTPRRKGTTRQRSRPDPPGRPRDGRSDLRKDENDKFDAIHADIDKLTGFITKLEKQEALAEPTGRRSEPAQPEPAHDTPRRQGHRGRARRGPARHGRWQASRISRSPTISARPPAAAGWTSTPSAFRAFPQRRSGTPAPKPHSSVADRQRRTARRADGAPVHDHDRRLHRRGRDDAGPRSGAARVRRHAQRGDRAPTATGGPLPIPTINDTSNKGAMLAENTQQRTRNDLRAARARRLQVLSKYVLASVEFLQDTSINVGGVDRHGARRAHRPHHERSLHHGHRVVAAQRHRDGGDVWRHERRASGHLRQLRGPRPLGGSGVPDQRQVHDPRRRPEDAQEDQGAPVLGRHGRRAALAALAGGGQPDTILGYPYVINQSMATPGSGVKSMLFGDFSKYIIRDVREVTLLRLDERFAELPPGGFLAFSRRTATCSTPARTPSST
jgi:hypothetical protein